MHQLARLIVDAPTRVYFIAWMVHFQVFGLSKVDELRDVLLGWFHLCKSFFEIFRFLYVRHKIVYLRRVASIYQVDYECHV